QPDHRRGAGRCGRARGAADAARSSRPGPRAAHRAARQRSARRPPRARPQRDRPARPGPQRARQRAPHPHAARRTMSEPCGCCEGVEVATPQDEANPPGLSALSYRVGDYATFFESMLARLSTLTLDITPPDGGAAQTLRPLAGLTTREPGDPSIALLDAWAVTADVLTFYQERIANEGYLPTALERRSLVELSRLIGYRLRPGVAASAKLAFTVASGFAGTLPAGTRAQSIPGPGQTPQFYETSAELAARDTWNTLAPRLTRPQ